MHGIAEAFLPNQRRTHLRDDGNHVVIIERHRVHHLHATALGVEPSEIERRDIGVTTASGTQNPGSRCERLDIFFGKFLKHVSPLAVEQFQEKCAAVFRPGLPKIRR